MRVPAQALAAGRRTALLRQNGPPTIRRGAETMNALNLSRRVVLFALGGVAAGAARADDAQKLAQAVYDRPNGRDLTTVSRMELTDKGRPPRIRELVTYRVDRGRGEYANLVRFLGPKDIAGTGLLSIDKADGSNEQWLYLPALDRVRRIAGDRKGGRFVGSDIYYEDLQVRNPASDRHRLLGKETVGGAACDVLESIPADAASSVYRKRVSWVDPQTLLAMRIDYFEKDDSTPSKRWILLARKQNQGFWTVTDSKIADLQSGHETRMVVESVQYDRKLPAKLFTSQALSDENIEAAYRP
jgi:hypothetical protein